MARRLPIERRVGLRIRALREEARLTQRELADRVGTSRSQVAAIERGTTSATVATLEAFAHALHTTIAALADDEVPARDDRPARLAARLRERPAEYLDLLEGAVELLDRAGQLGHRGPWPWRGPARP